MNTRITCGTFAAATLLVGAMLAAPRAAAAADPYVLDLTVDGQTYTRSYNNLDDLLNLLNPGGIRSIAPNYTSNSAVNAVVNFRGVPATVTSEPGSSALRLSVPGAGVDQVFDAGSLTESRRQLENFAKGEGDAEALKKIYDAVVSTSTADPVAGNPASLQGQSVMADYAAGTLLPGDLGRMEPRAAGWHFSVGGDYTRQETRDFDTNIWSLPLAVSYTFGQDGPELFLNLPLTLTDTSGAYSYLGSAGIGLRVPVVTSPSVRWALTPQFRFGAAGSSEVGSVGQAYGGSVTSDLRLALPNQFVLGIGNTIGYYETKPLKVSDYDLAYDLQNAYYRNGASISRPVGLMANLPVLLGASFVDTRMAGDDLAVKSWQEYGLFAVLGTTTPVRANISYLNGERGYDAFHVGLSVAF
ncbi:hypothetical protein E0493_08225 [Roseomonas sp. M0104]|uniref:Autotransporter outer membrane beta-barrel domain-containing protein n=1 Tax=Teichococcus coralli TaxID=2545983 RepID=A0A845BDB3_9PROT|nr:hypothetical protein [Pseudoroseomonas coralli]MXP63337.1 hypothetical protein [Pseudoroseomonas coralli]